MRLDLAWKTFHVLPQSPSRVHVRVIQLTHHILTSLSAASQHISLPWCFTYAMSCASRCLRQESFAFHQALVPSKPHCAAALSHRQVAQLFAGYSQFVVGTNFKPTYCSFSLPNLEAKNTSPSQRFAVSDASRRRKSKIAPFEPRQCPPAPQARIKAFAYVVSNRVVWWYRFEAVDIPGVE